MKYNTVVRLSICIYGYKQFVPHIDFRLHALLVHTCFSYFHVTPHSAGTRMNRNRVARDRVTDDERVSANYLPPGNAIWLGAPRGSSLRIMRLFYDCWYCITNSMRKPLNCIPWLTQINRICYEFRTTICRHVWPVNVRVLTLTDAKHRIVSGSLHSTNKPYMCS